MNIIKRNTIKICFFHIWLLLLVITAAGCSAADRQEDSDSPITLQVEKIPDAEDNGSQTDDALPDNPDTQAPSPALSTDSAEPAAPEKEAPTNAPASSADYAEAYLKQIQELDAEYGDDIKYDFIYFNEDDTPELVAGIPDYWVSMYTCKNGKLYTPMDSWGYGAMGNPGYEYIPRQNILRNYNNDYAGLIMYTSYCRMNDAFELADCYEESLYMILFDDKNGNRCPDEGEDASGEHVSYFYGDTEISETEYNSKLIDGDFQYIRGTLSKEDILSSLEKMSP